MSDKQYKCVFLDWDDTIGDFANAARLSLQEMYTKYRLSEFFASFDDFFSLYHPHNIELWHRYGEDEVSKDFLRIDRFLWPLVQALGGSPVLMQSRPLQDLARRMSDDFLILTTQHFALLPDAEEMVRYLAARYPLTIVSNGFIEVQYEKIARSGLQDLFTHIVLSEEVGCQKPNPRIYEVALERNGIGADEAVMIGDSWYSDIQGAQRAHIDQLWIRPATTPHPDGESATYIVHSLREIRDIL